MQSVRLLSNEEQREVLRSYIRIEILVFMKSIGDCSVPDLAEMVAMPADALYHHINILEQYGLIERVGVRKRGRHAETLYRRTATVIRPNYNEQTGDGHEEMSKLAETLLHSTLRSMQRALAEGNTSLYGDRRNIFLGMDSTWLTEDDCADITTHVQAIEKILAEGRSRRQGRLYTVSLFGCPIVRGRKPRAKAKRDTASD